jgi:hypothetical protein
MADVPKGTVVDFPKTYSLPTETLPTLDICHHLRDLRLFQEFLRGRGIQTEGTRIDRYIEYLQQVIAGERFDAAEVFKNVRDSPLQSPLDWQLYILREVHELMWILKGLERHVPAGIDKHLSSIVGGRDFAALDTDSQSRNGQFELRIASYFCQAGCDVDLSSATDIVARTRRTAFYVECKRVTSEIQLQKRLSEARKQLQSRIPPGGGSRETVGIIAADVTKIAFPQNGLTMGMTNEHSREVVQDKLVAVTQRAQTAPLFLGCKRLINCWFQIHIPSLILYPATPLSRFSSYHLLREGLSRKQSRAVQTFQVMFESASEDARTTPPRPLKHRKRIEVPAGTQFGFETDIFDALMTEGRVADENLERKVGSLTLGKTTHEFRVFDLVSIGGGQNRNWREDLGEDPVRARLELLMRMYANRFPFEE